MDSRCEAERDDDVISSRHGGHRARTYNHTLLYRHRDRQGKTGDKGGGGARDKEQQVTLSSVESYRQNSSWHKVGGIS